MTLKTTLLAAVCLFTICASIAGASASPLFTGSEKRAAFLSPMEGWRSTWQLEDYVSLLEGAGYVVDVIFDDNVSITFLMSQLGNYDLIILRTDSFAHEGFSYYCSGEPVTYQARKTYAQEISDREIEVGACLGFSSKFIQHNYPAGTIRNGMIFVIDGYSVDLSQAFLTAGAAVYVGYYDAYPLGWGRIDALSIKWLSYLAQGYSVKEANPLLYTYLYRSHGSTATWPSIFYYGNGSFKI